MRNGGVEMKRFLVAAMISAIALGSAMAQEACKAVSKDGKPLAGAAKASHMKKCCTDKAVSADGKPLSGAAKDSSIKKCLAGA
jgi:hypothetical protein